MPSYKNIHEFLIEHYKAPKKLSVYLRVFEGTARLMLDKTKIVSKVSSAKVLRKLLDVSLKSEALDPSTDEWFHLFQALSDCFEPIIDDFLLIAAFEHHAKAVLLGKGYVIHSINSPSSLKKKQKSEPVHVRTIKAAIRRGAKIGFSENTLGVSNMLSNKYERHFKLSESEIKGLKEAQYRRNLVHFSMGFSWSVTAELLAFVEYLNSKIPKIRTLRSRRRRKASV